VTSEENITLDEQIISVQRQEFELLKKRYIAQKTELSQLRAERQEKYTTNHKDNRKTIDITVYNVEPGGRYEIQVISKNEVIIYKLQPTRTAQIEGV